jgi:hypothetical protein
MARVEKTAVAECGSGAEHIENFEKKINGKNGMRGTFFFKKKNQVSKKKKKKNKNQKTHKTNQNQKNQNQNQNQGHKKKAQNSQNNRKKAMQYPNQPSQSIKTTSKRSKMRQNA